jgi:hypothetical protein
LAKISDETLPVRNDIISLLESDVLWDTFMDVLVPIFLEAQEHTLSDAHKEQIKKSLTFLQKIQAMEKKDREIDQKDIFELDQMLESI